MKMMRLVIILLTNHYYKGCVHSKIYIDVLNNNEYRLNKVSQSINEIESKLKELVSVISEVNAKVCDKESKLSTFEEELNEKPRQEHGSFSNHNVTSKINDLEKSIDSLHAKY